MSSILWVTPKAEAQVPFSFSSALSCSSLNATLLNQLRSTLPPASLAQPCLGGWDSSSASWSVRACLPRGLSSPKAMERPSGTFEDSWMMR
jgi:hypothetical protein